MLYCSRRKFDYLNGKMNHMMRSSSFAYQNRRYTSHNTAQDEKIKIQFRRGWSSFFVVLNGPITGNNFLSIFFFFVFFIFVPRVFSNKGRAADVEGKLLLLFNFYGLVKISPQNNTHKLSAPSDPPCVIICVVWEKTIQRGLSVYVYLLLCYPPIYLRIERRTFSIFK